MLEEKSPALRIVIVLLTTIGAVATVFSCVIAYISFVNPQRAEIVLKQLSSPSTSTPVVITVIAPTPTPYPTYTPYPIPISSSKVTQTPTGTDEQSPPPGEIVPAGQTISKAGMSVTMEKDIKVDGDLFGFSFTIKNSRADDYVIRYRSSQFKVVDDLDGQYALCACGYSQESLDVVKQFLIGSKQDFVIGPTRYVWSGVTDTSVAFFQGGVNPDATFLIVTIDKLAGMEDLKWRYDLE